MVKGLKKPICRFISAGVTCSPEYRSLNQDGPSRLLFLFLLIHPHGGSFHVPGIYKVGPETLRETCGLPKRAFARSLAELLEKHILHSDREAQLLWMPAALRLMGPPANPNMVKGYCRSILQFPSCGLLDVAIQAYRDFLSNLGPSFSQPFEEAFGDLGTDTTGGAAALSFTNGIERVSETYNHSNTNTDRYNQNNNYNPASDTSVANICGVPCARIADGLGWPELPEVTRQAYVAELPLLSESDVLRARAAVMGKPDVRDPWAYLFAILRRQSPRSSSHSTLKGATEDVDPFAAYADGEVVTFDD